MAVTKNNGTTIGTSATLPATFDSAGYAAVTFTTVGEVVDIGELGKVFNMITHQPIGQAYPTKLKGTYDIPDITLTIGRDIADAGQVLVAAALASDASYSFKVTLPSTNTGSFTGKVTKAAIGAIATDAVETLTVTIAIDPQSLFLA